MTDTPNLALPYILASQAQKHVTHNEAIRALDCLVQLSVESRVLTIPPASPADGSRYVVAAGASGDWAGHSNKIAAFQDGIWAFYTPRDGWIAWVASENIFIVYDAATWSDLPSGGVTDHGMLTGLADDDHLQYLTNARGDARYTPINPATLGINATADTTNRLALSSPASLFNHEGNGHQVKVNKHAASDTASFLFQDNFSGRAEIGLTGDDDFHFKVSADGSTWFEGIKIARATGKVSFPNSGGPREALTANRTYYVRTDGSDSNNGLANTTGGAFLTLQKAYQVLLTLDLGGFTVTVQIGDGTYTGGLAMTSGPILGGPVTWQGNTLTPSNVLISTSGADAIYLDGQGHRSTFQYFKVQTSGGYGSGFYATNGAGFKYSNINFGSCASSHMQLAGGGAILCTGNSTISGGAYAHFQLGSFGYIECRTRQ